MLTISHQFRIHFFVLSKEKFTPLPTASSIGMSGCLKGCTHHISFQLSGTNSHGTQKKKLGTDTALAPQKEIQEQQNFLTLEGVQTGIILTVDKMYIWGPWVQQSYCEILNFSLLDISYALSKRLKYIQKVILLQKLMSSQVFENYCLLNCSLKGKRQNQDFYPKKIMVYKCLAYKAR